MEEEMQNIPFRKWNQIIEKEYREKNLAKEGINWNEYKTTCWASIRWQIREGYVQEGINPIGLPGDKPVLKVTNYTDNVKQFYIKKPFFYDKNNIFWFWDSEKCCYKITDEIDLMNSIEDELLLSGETVTSQTKSNYIEAFKRFGRKNIPKEAPIKWIQFKNKAFSIHSHSVYEVQPNYFFTNPIPYKIGKTDKTSTMDKLFKEWVGEEYVKTLYEIIAYCCYRDYPIQILFSFYGSGRNGKSCFLKILSKFLGKDNICSTELDSISNSRFESFKLYKRLAAVMGETNLGILDKSSYLKKLTGGDLIGFEMKNKNPFDDFSYAKLLIASNSLPSSDDTSEGFYRRWLIIDFPNQFPEGKDILAIIPEEEYNNLARKVCKILPKLLERGSFTNQGSIKEREDKYIMASNPLPFFIKHFCIENFEGYIRYSELYNNYLRFLKINKRRRVSKKEFSKLLNDEGHETHRTSKEGNVDYYIEGISWNQDKCNLPDCPDYSKFSLSSLI